MTFRCFSHVCICRKTGGFTWTPTTQQASFLYCSTACGSAKPRSLMYSMSRMPGARLQTHTFDFSFIIILTNRGFHNLGERLWEFCHQHGLPFSSILLYIHKKTEQKRARARSLLTLQPNMSESVRLLHISLHWHITGEKHLRFLRGGDITSTPIDTKHTDHRPPALRSARGQKGTVMSLATVCEERAVFK